MYLASDECCLREESSGATSAPEYPSSCCTDYVCCQVVWDSAMTQRPQPTDTRSKVIAKPKQNSPKWNEVERRRMKYCDDSRPLLVGKNNFPDYIFSRVWKRRGGALKLFSTATFWSEQRSVAFRSDVGWFKRWGMWFFVVFREIGFSR